MKNKSESIERYESWFENGLVVLLFLVGSNLLVFLKFSVLEQIPQHAAEINKNLFSLANVRASVLGLFTGSLIIFHEKFLFPACISRPYWSPRIVWNTCTVFLITLAIFIVAFLWEWIIYRNGTYGNLGAAWSFRNSAFILPFFVYAYFVSLLFRFLLRLKGTFGQPIIYNFFMGKCASPKIEVRNFMFVELANACDLAETLGHDKYGRFLNFYFEDILTALKDFKYDVYQFVGEEIQLTWQTHIDKGQAYEMFMAIRQVLNDHHIIYENRFGIVPEIKTAVSSGEVIVSPVRDNSKTVAYHGAVLNTTARVIAQCHALNRDFLFTEYYLRSSGIAQFFPVAQMSSLKLNGIAREIRIYAVDLDR